MKLLYLSAVDFNLYLLRLDWLRAFVARGWSVSVATPEGRYSDRFADYGVAHLPYRIDRGSLSALAGAMSLKEVTGLLRATRPQILHNFTVKPNLIGSVAGRLVGVPIVINTVTGLGSWYLEERIKYRLVRLAMETAYRVACRAADRTIFQNDEDARYFIQRRIVPRNKAVVIKSSGVDTQSYRPDAFSPQQRAELRRSLGLRDDTVVVLFVGRLIAHKGIVELLEAARWLKAAHGDRIAVLLAGDYDRDNPNALQPAHLEPYARRGDVQLLGWCDNVRELMSICDIFALPTYREGMPRSVLEAMAMAKAVVTTDVAGCRETLEHGVSGELVAAKQWQPLAEAIDRLVRQPALRQRYGACGRERVVERFSSDVVVDQVARLYEELAAARGMPFR